jgi:hypothetical protein
MENFATERNALYKLLYNTENGVMSVEEIFHLLSSCGLNSKFSVAGSSNYSII